jgi:hypothetical protein
MEPFSLAGSPSARPCCFDPSPLFPVSILLMTIRGRRGWVERGEVRTERTFWSHQGQCSRLHARRVTRDCFCSCRVLFLSSLWVVGAVAGRASHRWRGKSDGVTRCRVQPCFPPHVACWKAAYVSHGALLVTAFPLLMLK